MKKGIWITTVVALVLVSFGLYLWGPSKTPPGQQPLMRISAANFTEFEAAFDAAAGGPRLVVQVSPT